MDFDALRKMCLGCPEDLWLLMCRCCQVCWERQSGNETNGLGMRLASKNENNGLGMRLGSKNED